MDKHELNTYAGRIKLKDVLPYCAPAANAMSLVFNGEAPKVAADNKWRCYIDPEFAATADKDEIASKMGNQMLHLQLDHAHFVERVVKMRGEKARDMATTATNMVVDDILNDVGLPINAVNLPESRGYPKGRSALEYFKRLEEEEGDEGDGDGDDQGQPEQGQGESEGQGEGEGEGEGQGPSCGDYGGSCADNVPKEYESSGGEHDPVDPGDAEALRMNVAANIKYGSDSRGTMPAGLQRFADELIEPPKVPWEEKLATLMSRGFDKMMGHNDFSLHKPHKRTLIDEDFEDIILPVPFKPPINALVAIDVSGSMHDKEIRAGLTETEALLKANGTPLRVLVCDTDITDSGIIESIEQVNLKGGGGTDLREAFEYVDEKMEEKPDIMVVVSDCYTPWPETAPDYETIVLRTRKGGGETPAWCKGVIDIEIV